MKKFITFIFILMLFCLYCNNEHKVFIMSSTDFKINVDHISQTIVPGDTAVYYLEVLFYQKLKNPVVLELENLDKNLSYQFSSQKIDSSSVIKLLIWHQDFKKEYEKFPIIVSARNADSQEKKYCPMWLYIFNPTKTEKLISLTIGNSDSLKQGVIQTIEGRVIPPGLEQVQLILLSPSREKFLIPIRVDTTGFFYHNHVFSQSGWWKATISNPGSTTIGSDSFYVLPRTPRIALTTQNHQFNNLNDSLLILGQVVAEKYPMKILFQINSPEGIKDSIFIINTDMTGHFQIQYPIIIKGMYYITASVNPEVTICVDTGESSPQHAIFMYDGSDVYQDTLVSIYLIPMLNKRGFQNSKIFILDIYNKDNYDLEEQFIRIISPIEKKQFLFFYLTGITSPNEYQIYTKSNKSSIPFQSLTDLLLPHIANFDTLVYFIDCDYGEVLLQKFANPYYMNKPKRPIGITSNKKPDEYINTSFTKAFRDKIDEDYTIKDSFYKAREGFTSPRPIIDDNGPAGIPDGIFTDCQITNVNCDGENSKNIKIGCNTGESKVLCKLSDAAILSNPSIGPDNGSILAVFDNPNNNDISELTGTIIPPSSSKAAPNTVSLTYDSLSGLYKSTSNKYSDSGTYTIRLNYTYFYQNHKKFGSYTFQKNRYDKPK